jgi:hypothetical protein
MGDAQQVRLAPARPSLIREQWARVCWSDETVRPDGEQTLTPSALWTLPALIVPPQHYPKNNSPLEPIL